MTESRKLLGVFGHEWNARSRPIVCRCERVSGRLKPDIREAANERGNVGYAGWLVEKRRASNSTGINFRPSSGN
jgi:hypothetical protein